jgi:hypothetical protein
MEGTYTAMELYELAVGCSIYKALSGDDSRVTRLWRKTGGQVDPYNSAHQKFLFEWLNQWGCRQFSRVHHDLIAAPSLKAWASNFLASLPSNDVLLEAVSMSQMEVIGAAYDDLRRREAGTRTLKDGSTSYVTYGPVGAAKTLFALRPNVCPPWDSYTLRALGLDHSGASYSKYLKRVISDLRAVSSRAGVQINELPSLIGRPNSTPPKLIDEYYWVTVTRGFKPPSRETLSKWAEWA